MQITIKDTDDQPIERTLFDKVCAKLDETLTNMRIKFIHEEYSYDKHLTRDYTLLLGSFEGYIMLENSEEFIIVTFFENGDDSYYDEHEDVRNPDEWDPENLISGLITFIKEKAKAEDKIEQLIDKILEICETYQLDPEDYIIVTKDFY
jgi:Holliday junction resolvasome RuvABC endonuclease subunit